MRHENLCVKKGKIEKFHFKTNSFVASVSVVSSSSLLVVDSFLEKSEIDFLNDQNASLSLEFINQTLISFQWKKKRDRKNFLPQRARVFRHNGKNIKNM